ncbi:EVE domain-containing protein [Macrococcus equipercicus]|uniref:EVE domain-containing protein n=1 Tax=Macrococcus equipercicus TaxID=69967 RepID=A0A9Q9BV05_9STAP|nr:EVE domain-containing protein [Macrococcus equipercicus]UTH13607.1 EVE domain-containing protein [Macrococcus equipercicus]
MSTHYFWLNCGYNRFNHFEELTGQISVFDSSVHFNPSEGYTAFKRARLGDKVIFYQVQNKVGLLGTGTVVKYEEPRRGKIIIHFKLEELLQPLKKEYLERSEQLKTMLYRMKEQLLNPLSEEDFNQILAVGRGEEKINRYFMMKEMENFVKDQEYTIFVRTVNGINRNGFKHYEEMQQGDKVIIYRTIPERGVYGVAEVVSGMQKLPVIQGRTDSTAIIIKYLGDIEPKTIYDLDREPLLRAQYFLAENWNESVTELTKVQYEVMLEEGDKKPEPLTTTPYLHELIKQAKRPAKPVVTTTKTFVTPSGRKYEDKPVTKQARPITKPRTTEKRIHLFMAGHMPNPHAVVMNYMKLEKNTPYYVADHTWTMGVLYGHYVEAEQVTFHPGVLTKHLADNTLIIENIEQLDADAWKPFLYAMQGQTVHLPFQYNGAPATIGRDATYNVDPNFRIIGITSQTAEEIKAHYPAAMHPLIKVYQFK